MGSNRSFAPEQDSTAFDMESSSRGFTTMAMTNNADSGGEAKMLYQCLHCTKRYGRIDHIQRHYRSHENGRAFRCSQCSKSFNRKDLLDRHQAIHGGTSSGDRSKRMNRTTRACRQCILAKTKCSNERPCGRCRGRSEVCRFEAKPAPTKPFSRAPDPALTLADSFADPSENSATLSSQAVDFSGPIEIIPESEATTIAGTISRPQGDGVGGYFPYEPAPMVLPDTNMQLNFEWNTSNWDDLDSLNDTTLPSNDFGLSIDADTFDALNQDWISLVATEHDRPTPANPQGQPSDPMVPQGRIDTSYSRILSGQEIFKRRSPWLWDPDPRDSASSEEAPELSEAEERSILPRALGERYPAGSRLLRLNYETNARDALLILVQEHSGPNVAVRSFPSAEMLTFLVRNFVVREDLGRCPFIHVSALVSDDCRTELLGAMISAGSSASGIPQIWKFGLALQERIRLAIYKLFDYDNSVVRRLDVMQAQILWVETGLWSGSQRKMEVAESAAANVPTMLRRAGVMNREYYEHNLIPTTEDNGDALRSKWLKWAELESFKRAVLRAMIDDVQSSVAYTKSPCFYSTEITFTLPAAREFWEASDPETWKSIYLAKRQNSVTSKPTLLDIIQDVSILRTLGQEYDHELASFVALHCLWPQQGAYLDAKVLNRGSPLSTKSSRGVMWLEAQRQDLYQKLGDMRDVFRSVKVLTPEALVVIELFMMSLFVWPVDIQKLAGQYGVKESRSTMPNLQTWAASDEPRYAMWHAGQVLRGAQSMTPAQLRGFYAVAVYHACLTLSLSFLLSAFGSTSTTACLEPESDPVFLSFHQENSSVSGQQNNIVILNGRDSIQTKSYLLTGQGSPALSLGDEVKLLSSIDVVPDIIAGIFGKNHSANNNHLPLLLEKLVTLMRDLARVAGRPD